MSQFCVPHILILCWMSRCFCRTQNWKKTKKTVERAEIAGLSVWNQVDLSEHHHESTRSSNSVTEFSFAAPGWLVTSQSFAKKHPLQSWAKSMTCADWICEKIGNSIYHGNPKPSFLGVITHMLGVKPSFFMVLGSKGSYPAGNDHISHQCKRKLIFPSGFFFHRIC